jgi:hypothetical protein
MKFKNSDIDASFELPDDPDFEQIDKFDSAMQTAFAEKKEMTDAQYDGLRVRVATDCALIKNWQSATRDSVPLTTLERQDARAIIWAGEVIGLYVRRLKILDPKSLGPLSPMPEVSQAL